MKTVRLIALICIVSCAASCEKNDGNTTGGEQPGDKTGAITLDKTSMSLRTTDRERLTATTNTNTVSWSSSDPDVAIVDGRGIVTATGAGKAVITATGGSKSAGCNVNVGYSVIVGGYDPYHNVPVLWKNGEKVEFSSYNAPKGINGVFVHNGEIYMVGTRTDTYLGVTSNAAVVIRLQTAIPGEPTSHVITDQLMERRRRSFGNSIFISNGNMYVAGTEILLNSSRQEYNEAVLWINGRLQPRLSSSDVSVDADANSVFVAGSDVYVAGNYGYYVDDGVWKNGQFALLSRPSEDVRVTAYAVCASGGDIYAAGCGWYKVTSWNTMKPVLWKNGVPTVLDENGCLYSVFASGGDVYAAGSGSVSPVWKNGVPMSFDANPLIESVYVYGNDVYATGKDGLWINGAKQSWGAYGSSVFVK